MSFKPLYDETRERLRDGSAKNPIEVTVESRNVQGFESAVRIRDFGLTVDQPRGFSGTNKGPKPSEVLLAALASCQEITYRLYADALGIPLNGIRVTLTGTQDLRGFLGTEEGVPAGFGRITGTVHVDSPAGDDDLRRLKDTVDRHCPVLDDLRRPVEVTIEAVRETQAAEAER